MKMSDNPTKYEVLIEQYLRSILDISAFVRAKRMEELWVLFGFIWKKWNYAIGRNIVTRKT